MQHVTRRRFIQLAGSSAALGVIGKHCQPLGNAGEPGEKPLFRFVQWNDLHVDVTRSRARRLADEKVTYLVEWINAAGRSSRYDFVIGVGDMIHGGDLLSLASDVRRFKLLIRDLKIPFHPVIGNHENMGREGESAFEAPFREAFAMDRTNYTLRHKGFLFVMLNNSGAPRSNRRPVGRRRNAWLRRVLEASTDVPKIICCHIPLVPVRDGPVLAKSFGFTSSGYAVQDDELRKLVDKHADTIVAVLSGHLHLTGMVKRNGVHHVVISGTLSYPCDFATYDVFRDRVRVRVRGLPKRLLTPQTNIHGKPRHKVDYTDAGHPTHESYIKGNASERDFEIVLPTKTLSGRPSSGI